MHNRVIKILLAIVFTSQFSLAQRPTTRPSNNATSSHPHPDIKYKLGVDSQVNPDVPHGKIIDFDWTHSDVFPSTIRHCSIYIPAQYDENKPASLMVFQDGHTYLKEDGDFRAPVVFDNLIARKEIAVLIGLFIDPGFKESKFPTTQRGWRPEPQNRSFEYDSLSPAYSDFLLNEILPHIKKEYHLNISDDPESHAICGISSGGICAFTVAWTRPDQFRKVVTHVGSFTNIRGGNAYPKIIRDTDPKPLRIFLQDNQSDLRNRREGWNWVEANHLMAAALEYKDYDYKYTYGEGSHNSNFGGSIFPDTLRWIWRDSSK